MKKIALINDLSGFGKCSLSASIPVISAMGIQACPLPTAILSAQTGFAHYCCSDCTQQMDAITDTWNAMNVHFDGIASGFLANPEQIGKVMHFLDLFQEQQTLYLVDPVLGDHGQVIKNFSAPLLTGMQKLCSRADVCTPNLTELCLLTDTDYSRFLSCAGQPDYLERIADTARHLIRQNPALTVLITGISRRKSGQHVIGNLAVSAEDMIHLETAFTGKSFSGTGDLFASVICGALVRGQKLHSAMQLASDFLYPAIEESSLADCPEEHGILFEKYLSVLCS